MTNENIIVTDAEKQHGDIFESPIGKFNVKDGSMLYFKNEEEIKEAKVSEYEQYFWSLPKHNCKYCHERGYVYVDVLTKFYVPCRCIKPRYRTIGLRKKNSTEKEK